MGLAEAEQYAAVMNLFQDSELGPLVTPRQAAEILNLKPAAIQRALKAGRLRGVRVGSVGGRWRIPITELARFTCGQGR